jgi:hypothetical protein
MGFLTKRGGRPSRAVVAALWLSPKSVGLLSFTLSIVSTAPDRAEAKLQIC